MDNAVSKQGPWESVQAGGGDPIQQGRLPGESDISAQSGRVRRNEPGTNKVRKRHSKKQERHV